MVGSDCCSGSIIIVFLAGVVCSAMVFVSSDSSWSAIASLGVSMVFSLFAFLFIAVICKVSWFSAIEAFSVPSSLIFLILRESLVLGSVVGKSLVLAMVVILGAPAVWLGYSIGYCIAEVTLASIYSC